jgi:hypothetical protein
VAPRIEKPNLWDDATAIDVLALPKDGGLRVTSELNIPFAAPGDLGKVVRSLVGLTETHARACTIMLNDRDIMVTVRNALLLLVTYYFSEDEAVAIMIHV